MTTTLNVTKTEAELIAVGVESLTSTYLHGHFNSPDKRIGSLPSEVIYEFALEVGKQVQAGTQITTEKPRSLKALLTYWEMQELADRVEIDD